MELREQDLGHKLLGFPTSEESQAYYEQMDKEATDIERRRIGGEAIVENSYFGKIIEEFSQTDMLEGLMIEIMMPPGDQNSQAVKDKLLAEFKAMRSKSFVSLCNAYLGVFLSAFDYKCPYMPETWIREYVKEKEGFSDDQFYSYIQEVCEFVGQFFEGRLLATILYRSTNTVGPKGASNFLMLIGMLIEAKRREEIPAEALEWESSMSSKIIEELEDLI